MRKGIHLARGVTYDSYLLHIIDMIQGTLSNLEILILNDNDLQGTIPRDLAALSKVSLLHITLGVSVHILLACCCIYHSRRVYFFSNITHPVNLPTSLSISLLLLLLLLLLPLPLLLLLLLLLGYYDCYCYCYCYYQCYCYSLLLLLLLPQLTHLYEHKNKLQGLVPYDSCLLHTAAI